MNQRKSERLRAKISIAMTPNGTCRVNNLSKGGLAFTCFEELLFPPELTVDVYDGAGLNLQGLKVKKVWTKKLNKPGISPYSQVEVGLAFKSLSSYQEVQIDSCLLQLMAVDGSI